MSDQVGIPNAFTLNQRTRDLHSFRKLDSTAPARTYFGCHVFGQLGTGQVAHDIIWLTPVIMPQGLMLKKITYKVTAAVAGVIHLGIYSNVNANLYPDRLLVDWGAHSIAVPGDFWIDVDYFLHNDIVYYIARWISLAGAWMTSISSNLQFAAVGHDGLGATEPNPGIGFKKNRIYDALLPTVWPNYASGGRVIPNDERIPLIGMRLHNL